MSSYRPDDFRPVLLQYDETRGDGGDSSGWLDTCFIDRVRGFLTRLHGGGGVLRDAPVVEELYTELWRRAYSGGRLVRMDLANFICGSLGNIMSLCNSEVLREANREAAELVVTLGLEGRSRWRDELGRLWVIEEMGGTLRMVRCMMVRGRDGSEVRVRRTFFMQVLRVSGGLRGYVYTYDEAERLFNREDAGDVSVFVSVRLSDGDGCVMVDEVEGERVRVMEFELVNKDMRRGDQVFRAKSLSFVRRLGEDDEEEGWCESDVERENAVLVRERYFMRNGDYGYLACELEDVDGKGVVVRSWFRIPLWRGFVSLSGVESDMRDLSGDEGVVLRRLRSKLLGGEWRYVLHFARRGVIVDVTEVMCPCEGAVMPYGITLVRRAGEGFLSSECVWVGVIGARVARGVGGGLVMRVEYERVDYGRRERDGEGREMGRYVGGRWFEDEELLGYGG